MRVGTLRLETLPVVLRVSNWLIISLLLRQNFPNSKSEAELKSESPKTTAATFFWLLRSALWLRRRGFILMEAVASVLTTWLACFLCVNSDKYASKMQLTCCLREFKRSAFVMPLDWFWMCFSTSLSPLRWLLLSKENCYLARSDSIFSGLSWLFLKIAKISNRWTKLPISDWLSFRVLSICWISLFEKTSFGVCGFYSFLSTCSDDWLML